MNTDPRTSVDISHNYEARMAIALERIADMMEKELDRQLKRRQYEDSLYKETPVDGD